jgi:hypothetical protein
MNQTSIAVGIFLTSAIIAMALWIASRRRREQPLLLTTRFPGQAGQPAAAANANLRSPGPTFILYLCNFGERRRVVSDLLFRYDQGRQLRLESLTLASESLGQAMNTHPIPLQARAIHPLACPWSAINAGFIGVEVELDDGTTHHLADIEVAQLKAIAERRQAPFTQPRGPNESARLLSAVGRNAGDAARR